MRRNQSPWQTRPMKLPAPVTYDFTGPDGRPYSKSTKSTHADTANAQFIHHPERGWCFIGLQSIAKYVTPCTESDPKIVFVTARKRNS